MSDAAEVASGELQDALRQEILAGRSEDTLRAFLRARVREFVPPEDARSWLEGAPARRRDALGRVFLRGVPPAVIDADANAVWTGELRPDPAYVIRKLRYEAYPGLWIPALLYEPSGGGEEAVPVVLNVMGHGQGGKATDYQQARCANLARRGMLALSIEFLGMGELGADVVHNQLAYLELVGMAAPSLMYLALRKGLDVLLGRPRADQTRVAVTGLSGGGWQTIVLSALDPRVTVSVPVAGYTSVAARIECREDIGDLEQVPADLAAVLDYQEMTGMVAPRPALLILNHDDDCCFQTGRTKPVIYDQVVPVYAALGAAERFRCHDNTDPGTHNYDRDNRIQLYRFLDEHFGLQTPAEDLHGEHELLPELLLRVGLPEDQQTIGGIATARARALAAARTAPEGAEACARLRARVRDAVRLPSYDVAGNWRAGARDPYSLSLEIGPWIVPATVVPGPGPDITLMVADDGRAGLAEQNVVGGGSGTTVVIDILGTGELRAFTGLQMLVNCTGARLLGIQVAQVLAAARLAADRAGADRVQLEGRGLVSAIVTLVAAALEPALFERLTVTGSMLTLGHLIEQRVPYEWAPSAFCPGLLEVADVPELVALLGDVVYVQPQRGVPSG